MEIVSFDIDGTLAEGPFKPGDILSMRVRQGIVHTLRVLLKAGYRVRIVTARPETYRPQTVAWLRRHAIPYHELRMREDGDNRQDPDLRAEQTDGVRIHFDDKPGNCAAVRARCVRV